MASVHEEAPRWSSHRIRSTLYRAVPWRGLRRFGQVRSLDGVPGSSLQGEIEDLGAGKIAYQSGGEIVAVDVLAREILWRRPQLTLLGRSLEELLAWQRNDEGVRIHRLDA